MSILSVTEISKRFGQHAALDRVSLTVDAGEFVSLLGPSGCGKTTLLRLVAGFLQPSEGRVAIEGKDVTALPPDKRPLNTVFQNYALFPHMTLLENVCYGPLRNGAREEDARSRAVEALNLVGLAGLQDRYPREASGGQQQRAALARAIVNRPKLLLLDEPLSALDLQLRRRMQVELKQLQEKLGIAFIFVTHDQEEAMAMSDRIVVMNAGAIEQVGSGRDIYRAPKTRFVSQFIGDANLFAASPLDDWDLRPEPEDSTGHSTRLAIVRPEHIEVEQGSITDDNRVALRGIVEAVTAVGGVTTIRIGVGDATVTSRRLGMDVPIEPGTPVDLSIERHHVHFVDS